MNIRSGGVIHISCAMTTRVQVTRQSGAVSLALGHSENFWLLVPIFSGVASTTDK